MEIKIVVYTGPPGSGKDGVLESIPNRLAKETDWYPMVVPEAATLASVGGVGDLRELKRSNFKKFLRVQEEIFDLDRHLTEHRLKEAEILGVKKLALLKNRAAPDMMVYMGDIKSPHIGRANFIRMIQNRGLNLAMVRERYSGVVFLNAPAAKHYTRANNKARTERTAVEAAALELPTKLAWLGHPHQWIVKSAEDFEEKTENAYRATLNILGTDEIERRFRLLRAPNWNSRELRHAQFVNIRQRYLRNGAMKSGRIRKRVIEEDGSVTYHFTQKSAITSVTRSEIEKDILYAEYRDFKELQDPDTRVIKKRRGYVIGEDQVLEIDAYREFPGLFILECELLREDDPVVIPPFLGEAIEVTDDLRYRNSAIAKLSWKMPQL